MKRRPMLFAIPGFGKLEIGMTKLAAAGLAIGLVFMAATAPGASAAAIGGVCAAELQSLCPNTTGHALKQCRNAHRASFSPACKQSLAASHLKVKDIKLQ
jgi:hypothetical protein